MQRKLTNKEIREILNHVKSSCPSPPTVSSSIYNTPKHINDIDRIQEVSDHMGYFLGLLQSVTVITRNKQRDRFVAGKNGNTTHENDVADYSGLYTVCRTGQRNIEIVMDSGFYYKHYLAVIAHEIAHHYLFHHSINPNGFDGEIYTDLAAIYLGFGLLLIDGYAPCQWSYGTQSHNFQLGYIDVSTIKRSLLQAYSLRDWKINDIVRKFRWFEHKYYFLIHLFPRAVLRSLLSSKSKTIVTQTNG